jgi:hypothetical protein
LSSSQENQKNRQIETGNEQQLAPENQEKVAQNQMRKNSLFDCELTNQKTQLLAAEPVESKPTRQGNVLSGDYEDLSSEFNQW